MKAVRSAISAEVHSDCRRKRSHHCGAVRSAISAEVHSDTDKLKKDGLLLFALPFRQRFTAEGIFLLLVEVAVRSAISAEVHSYWLWGLTWAGSCSLCHFGRGSQPRTTRSAAWDGCSLCHFGRGSQQGRQRRPPPSKLFALPFRQRFTAATAITGVRTIRCSLCHFGRGSQRDVEWEDGYACCSLCHFGRGSQQPPGFS